MEKPATQERWRASGPEVSRGDDAGCGTCCPTCYPNGREGAPLPPSPRSSAFVRVARRAASPAMAGRIFAVTDRLPAGRLAFSFSPRSRCRPVSVSTKCSLQAPGLKTPADRYWLLCDFGRLPIHADDCGRGTAWWCLTETASGCGALGVCRRRTSSQVPTCTVRNHLRRAVKPIPIRIGAPSERNDVSGRGVAPEGWPHGGSGR